MHGSNAFTAGVPVAEALTALGLRPAADRAEAARLLEATGFAYLPLAALSPGLDRLLRLRSLLGLRSPVNTVARLLDPFDAAASVDGVFHPPYIAVHLAASERLGRRRLLVVKGGGGEAERNPAKPTAAHLLSPSGRAEVLLPATRPGAGRGAAGTDLRAVWRGEEEDGPATATVLATIALGLLALGAAATAEEADARVAGVWRGRGAG
jgi:anthranilate phosphoribosyltransferase